MSTTTRSRRPSALDASIRAWHDAGLIDEAQAESIRSFEASRSMPHDVPTVATAPTRKVPFVAEALGYLGGMLGVIGVVALGARYWSDMSVAVRLAVAMAAVAVLVTGGALVPNRGDGALERLRAFLWTGATAAAVLAGGVFTADVVGVNGPDDPTALVLGAAAPATVLALVLWWRKDRPVQQALFLVGLLVVAGTAAAQFAGSATVGLLVWCLAAVVLWSGIAHLEPTPVVAVAIGALGTQIGAALTLGAARGPGLLFWLVTVAALLTFAATEAPVATTGERVALLVVAGLFGAQALPQTILWFGEQAGIATGAAVWCVGALVIAASGQPWVRTRLTAEMAGGALLVIGAAAMGMQDVAVATVLGLLVASALIVVGTVPGHAVLSLFGCLGLLINVPWAISHFFPGEGRAPLLIAVSGLLLVVIAVWLSHQSGELRRQLGHPWRGRRHGLPDRGA